MDLDVSVGGVALIILGVLIVITSVTLTLKQLINFKKIPYYVTILVWIGWACCFGIILLLPIDVIMSLYTNCENMEASQGSCVRPWVVLRQEQILPIWRMVYWTAYPFMQAYVYAGDYKMIERVKTALYKNLRYWAILLAVVTPFVVYLFIVRGIGKPELIAGAMEAANAWGLILFICFLGYGMVEIPRSLWRKSNRHFRQKRLQFDIVGQKADVDASRRHLESIVGEVKYYDHQITSSNAIRPFLDLVISRCPKEIYQKCQEVSSVRLGREGYSSAGLAELHTELKKARDEVVRSRSIFEITIRRLFRLEDVEKSKHSNQRAIRWSFQSNAKGRFIRMCGPSMMSIYNRIEWVYRVYLQNALFKLLAIICVCLSAALLWTEVFFTVPKPDLSIFSILLEVPNRPYALQWAITVAPISYIVFCSYWSLLRIKIFKIYRILPNQHTDANSILWVTMYLCRMTAPIAYNYLLASRVENTAYYQLMGRNLFFENYEKFFPILLVVVVIFYAFNMYTWCVHKLCFKSFHHYAFHEQVSDEIIAKGREIMDQEREIRERRFYGKSNDLEAGVLTPGLLEEDQIRISMHEDDDVVTTGILREPLRFPDFKQIFLPKNHKKFKDEKEELLRDDHET